ncbi:Thyrostimulin beta-5 subunit [Eumeta japonica]|uniref:Thyrostimulin beta-5 subunit n=1 Tax=Eumeta variegata TaxID=151549 RepID=A0A4C1UYT5_EUMVA|nr:Thyrostimulin beta-5 subunit [Eumeta japonica]
MTSNDSSRLSRWLVWLGVWCAACSLAEAGPQSLRCNRRFYRHRAMQTDMNGLRCWGDVKIMSCWGRCLSSEVADWQFPYKKSDHPVCVHGERRHASTRLPHCEPGVAPGTEIYHFVEARNCRCQVVIVASQSQRSHQCVAGLLDRNKTCDGGGLLEGEWGYEEGSGPPELSLTGRNATANVVCSSEDTSCEWLPPDTDAMSLLLSKHETDDELE